jgi:acetyl esterase/lipase
MLWLLRAAFAALQLLVASLALRKPPHKLLWYVRIGVTEWGYWLAPLLVAPLLPAWRRLLGAPLAIGGAMAAALAGAPLVRALLIARTLPREVERAFGGAAPIDRPAAPGRPAPLVFADLVRGLPAPGVTVDRMPYVTRDDREYALDLYRPRERMSALPLVLVIHGGAWEGGDNRQLPELNRYFAARGYAVAAINYRLAPQYRFPAPTDDAAAAIAFLRAHADALQIDAGRVALIGRSAGGHIALHAAYTLGDPAIRAVAAFYAPTDMHYGYANPANPAVIDTHGVMTRFLGGAPHEIPDVYDAASPVNFVGPTTPPTLCIHGDLDEMVFPPNSRMLAQRLLAHGRPHLLLALPWGAHGCDANLCGPAGQLSVYAIERLLAATLSSAEQTG